MARERNTLDADVKEILRKSPEGKAYVEYNEKIGGERIAPTVPYGYPKEVERYLEAGGSLEDLYRECIKKGISWEEMLGVNIEYDPDIII